MLVARLTAGALCYCAAAFVLPLAAAAAEISLQENIFGATTADPFTSRSGSPVPFFSPPNDLDALSPPVQGMTYVSIIGGITPDDPQRFEETTKKLTGDPKQLVTVVLAGPGGNLIAGLSIGIKIHERGWMTSVLDNSICESVCGAIWIAGVPRGATKTSHIGFHAAYNPATQRETGAGNAVLGSYLTKMGLSYDAIAFLTTPGPAQITYLSAEAAAKYGIAVDGELPSQASLAPPQAARKVVGKPYVDRNGNYVIPADMVPYWGNKGMFSGPPNYEQQVRTLQLMFRTPSGPPVTTGPDGSVIIPAEAVLTHVPRCDRTCSYQVMDEITRMTFNMIHQLESGVIPPQGPEIANNIPEPPPCSLERLHLARRYQNLGVDYQLRALELCPFEMCPLLGSWLMEVGRADWAMAAARLCPQL